MQRVRLCVDARRMGLVADRDTRVDVHVQNACECSQMWVPMHAAVKVKLPCNSQMQMLIMILPLLSRTANCDSAPHTTRVSAWLATMDSVQSLVMSSVSLNPLFTPVAVHSRGRVRHMVVGLPV